MRKLLLAVAFTATVASNAEAQHATDPRVADLVRAGKVRVALYPPLYSKDQATGELRSGLVLQRNYWHHLVSGLLDFFEQIGRPGRGQRGQKQHHAGQYACDNNTMYHVSRPPMPQIIIKQNT
jgi:hypothetical protein